MIVNADDFGLGVAANQGIVGAFGRGLVSSTTLMANGDAFDEAVELAHEHGLRDHVGVHLVLTEGVPLTAPIRSIRRFCDDDGRFRAWPADGHLWWMRRSERDATLRELAAQIERVRSAGLPVTHLDSHHHVHNEWAILGCVVAVARQAGIRHVRIARNCGPGIGTGASVYKRVANRRLRARGLARTRWFGEIDDWCHLRDEGEHPGSLDDFEVMTHPVLDGAGAIVDPVSDGRDLESLLAPLPTVFAAMSYSGARRA